MRFQQIDQFAAELKADTRAAVYQSTKGTHEKRTKLLFDQFADPNRLRQIAGEIKQHTIENLDTYLPQVEAKLKSNGVQVHWASTAENACEAVLKIMQARGASKLVKAKTMVSEEIELEHYLKKHGLAFTACWSKLAHKDYTLARLPSACRLLTQPCRFTSKSWRMRG